jgi:hypothetical protein
MSGPNLRGVSRPCSAGGTVNIVSFGGAPNKSGMKVGVKHRDLRAAKVMNDFEGCLRDAGWRFKLRHRVVCESPRR